MDREALKAAFDEALTLPPEDRAAFANWRFANDPATRQELLALLASYDESAGFLARPALGVLVNGAQAPEPPSSIGGYRVVRLIAEGGMGVVYEGLRESEGFAHRVAIKLVKHGLAAGYLIDRFLAERAILARLNHPHIARLFDGGATEDGMPFFVMEFVPGLPIHEYCRQRATPVRDRVRMVRDAAQAIAYAHANKVLHRDLKPGNILVSSSGAVKVVDFGVARAMEEEPGSQPATATLLRIVTPEYASPEQLRGAAVDTRSDVFSLGVVLYELLAGSRPGAGPSPKLPRPLLAITRRAMAPEPDQRYPSAEEFAADLDRWLSNRPVSARDAAASWRSWSLLLLVVALAAALTLGLVLRWRTTTRPPPATLAVASFRSLSGDASTAWIGVAAEDIIAAELADGEAVRTVAAEDIARARALGRVKRSADDLAAFREMGADLVLVGSFLASGSQPEAPVRVSARLLDAASGAPRGFVTETGSHAEIAALLTRLARRVGESLGNPPGGVARTGFRETESLRLLASGLERLAAFDPLGARVHLERAAGLDPGNGAIRWALARALWELGYGAKAREEAARALAAPAAGRTSRLRMEAFACRAGGDQDCLARRLEELATLEPGNQSVARELAVAYHALGQPEAAERTLAELKERGGAGALEALLAELELAQARNDGPRLRAAAAVLLREAETRRWPLLRARAAHTLAVGDIETADFERAARRLAEAEQAYRDGGYRLGVLRVGGTRANIAMQQGHREHAVRQYLQLAAAARELGHIEFEGQSLGNAAVALVRAGDAVRALPAAQSSVALLRQAGQQTYYGSMLNVLGAIHSLRGEQAEAARCYRETAALGERLRNFHLMETGYLNAAGLALEMGRLSEFQDLLTKGAAAVERTGWTGGIMAVTQGRAALSLEQGRLDEAQTGFQQALALARKIGDLETVANAHFALAWLHLLLLRPREADQWAAKAAGEVERGGLKGHAADLEMIRAMARASLGDHQSAARHLDRARRLLGPPQGHSFGMRFRPFAEAWVHLHAGRDQEAAEALRSRVAESAERGLGSIRFDAALLLARAEANLGRRTEAARLRSWVRTEAASAGFTRAAELAAR